MTVSAPKPNLSFRPATPDDVPLLLPLIRSAYRGSSSRKGWTTEADLLDDKRIDAAGVLAKIQEPEGVILLVTDDSAPLPVTTTTNETEKRETVSQPVACCEVLRKGDGNMAYFGLFAVNPDLQAAGIGRRVLEYAENFARERWAVRGMEMWVIWTREELISWYERRGYRRTGKTAEFPYAELVGGEALRDDLYFVVLEKDF
ncbi:uncharacterized protein CTRU02_213860 [Colletotrichum truncatum]|uniref:Uncharacterized protein n=1 Tax=Colletotrichum truncatum TaxID=5467 RepID=A0ACC3YGW6_COLTU|nr:uncharacterized protein CTRU02_12882 [Colletotrichum truncatum]KAF6784115.1 hypothetical protein CTRU02_12882 [Colletotrichum truncatum]